MSAYKDDEIGYKYECNKEEEYTLREYTKEEYESDVKNALHDKGLYNVVEGYCDKIEDEVKGLSYITHRTIQEFLCNILDAIRFYEDENNDK